jgi:hypothetical protein
MESRLGYMFYYSVVIGSAPDALTVDYYLAMPCDTF